MTPCITGTDSQTLTCLLVRYLSVTIYRFYRPFSSSLHSILENVFSISSRTLWNARMLVSISSLVDQFWQEWQNNEFVWKNDEFDWCIRNSLSDRDEFQWQLTNLNAEFFNLIDEKRMWMTIWRNWTLDLNAVSFSGRNWIENWWNWMKRWRKWAGKPILSAFYRRTFVTFVEMNAEWPLNWLIIGLCVRKLESGPRLKKSYNSYDWYQS